MAAGINALRVGWPISSRAKNLSNVAALHLTRSGTSSPPSKGYAWQNYFWGTTFASTPKTLTLIDPIGGLSRAAQVNAA